jgi:hypothetical protein
MPHIYVLTKGGPVLKAQSVFRGHRVCEAVYFLAKIDRNNKFILER